ncbi:MAG: KpsF/GutQ family sugar-phosphate isomerase [Candidatus Eisenbacteria bacterium]|uniref:KpsF/GutQ family sugar-phosphate isomerase n=1 Tax=Eiseniibacteriota bacterium TaxID=2212470 RepID=A0A538TUD9_UNCEI|nr:MAG: KpsF/GutQ family sugar-phosphate isomerase [Candidatus Eisenbacteria bacterium]
MPHLLRRDPLGSAAGRRGDRRPAGARSAPGPGGGGRGRGRPLHRDPPRSGARAVRPGIAVAAGRAARPAALLDEDPPSSCRYESCGDTQAVTKSLYREKSKAGVEPASETQVAAWAREVLALECEAIQGLKPLIGKEFEAAIQTLSKVRGQVLTLGVGKSGLVAKKIAATLTGTGTPATFVHPVDAVHGDLGIVSRDDAAILLSKSGETAELLELLPAFRRRGVAIITMTCHPESSLGTASDHVLDLGRPPEACPENLVPTSTTTAALALGDAVAIVLMRLKGFTREDFVFLHPGGVVGQAALLRVEDRMHGGDALPRVGTEATLRDALLEILNKRLGMTTVVDRSGVLRGILTDGDLKRILLRGDADLAQAVEKVMSRAPRSIEADALIAQAVRKMEENEGGAITSLVVLDPGGRPLGVIHLHDCLDLRTR